MIRTWRQLWAFPRFSGLWKSSQASSGVFLRGLLVIQDRTAGQLRHGSRVAPHPKHIKPSWRRKMELSSNGFAKPGQVCTHREKSTHHHTLLQPLGRCQKDRCVQSDPVRAGRCDRSTASHDGLSESCSCVNRACAILATHRVLWRRGKQCLVRLLPVGCGCEK